MTSTCALGLYDVTAGYKRSVVLRGVTIEVPYGQVVALLGSNGVGKTTTLRVASGLVAPTAGQIKVGDIEVTRMQHFKRAKSGLCHIPEGRGIFRNLTVSDNLRLQVPPWADDGSGIDEALEAFPVLGDRLKQLAGSLSGGEQQMLALARAFLSSPKVVLLDEVSMGLSPLVLDEVFMAIRTIAASGVALLIVEQYVDRVLQFADSVVLLDKGSVVFSGPPSSLDQDELTNSYLGGARPSSVEEEVVRSVDSRANRT